jgi:hypothetical protein
MLLLAPYYVKKKNVRGVMKKDLKVEVGVGLDKMGR